LDIVDRLFALVDTKYSQQQQFAADIGVHPTRVSEWRKRKSASYVKRLEIISKVLDTTPQYLLSGELPDKKASSPVPEPGSISHAGLSATQAELLGKFARLTPAEQREVLAFIDFKLSQRPPLSSGQGQEAM